MAASLPHRTATYLPLQPSFDCLPPRTHLHRCADLRLYRYPDIACHKPSCVLWPRRAILPETGSHVTTPAVPAHRSLGACVEMMARLPWFWLCLDDARAVNARMRHFAS